MFCLPSLFHVTYSSSMVPGGLEVLERKDQLDVQTKEGEDCYLQIIDNTGHTLDLVANGAGNILGKSAQ
jgi:hypothetical protein